jgi:hypothetical protein
VIKGVIKGGEIWVRGPHIARTKPNTPRQCDRSGGVRAFISRCLLE